MAAAIPAAIGVGSSIVGGIKGKGAAKKQQQLAEQQRRDLLPLIQAQVLASTFGLDTARRLFPEAESMFRQIFSDSQGQFEKGNQDYDRLLGDAERESGELTSKGRGFLDSSDSYLKGASTAISDLQNFYKPFMQSGNAIDRFLPSARRTREQLAPEFGEINRGFDAAQQAAGTFAPRGGGRISTLARGDLNRQSQLSDTFFKGRQNLRDTGLNAAFQSAGGQGNVIQLLKDLGLGTGQLGLGTIGAGTSLLGTKGGLAMGAKNNALNSLQTGLSASQGLGGLGTTGLGVASGGGQGAQSLYNAQANRAYGSAPSTGTGNQLGGFLVDLFSNKGVQDKVGGFFGGLFGGGKGNDIIPGTDFNYGYGQG
jgi:hypothetical protein